MICCLCSRPLRLATVFIGPYPVGPVCARRAGLVEVAQRGRAIVHLGPARARARRRSESRQLDLDFEQQEEDLHA